MYYAAYYELIQFIGFFVVCVLFALFAVLGEKKLRLCIYFISTRHVVLAFANRTNES